MYKEEWAILEFLNAITFFKKCSVPLYTGVEQFGINLFFRIDIHVQYSTFILHARAAWGKKTKESFRTFCLYSKNIVPPSIVSVCYNIGK
jgi:hypothetical protein